MNFATSAVPSDAVARMPIAVAQAMIRNASLEGASAAMLGL